MSNEPKHNTDPIDGFDLGAYRNAVAKYIKLLIRARAKTDPCFLTPAQFERWHLNDITNDPYAIDQLLQMAAAAHDHLWRTFIGPHGSGGVAADDPNGNLKQAVVNFTMGVSPAELLDQCQQDQPIDWDHAANWGLLDELRNGLDALPKAKPIDPSADCPIVVVNGPQGDVEVCGKPVRLTKTRMNIIQSLVEAYPHSLTKDKLVKNSKCGDAVNALKRLSKEPSWEAVIRLPGKPGRGYAIKSPPRGT